MKSRPSRGKFRNVGMALAALLVFVLPAAAWSAAQADKDPLTVNLTLKRVQADAQGKESLVA
ncbi:MAG: hypothetical protein K0B01_13670, partial [Syntrophobacterales bacterium]|nr:hypothetical protein [Syntrophobacterales bacterium]